MAKYLLTKQDIENFEGIDKSHFLNPETRRIDKSLGDLTGLTDFGIHMIEVEPGIESTELHRHHYEDECVYILEGSATAVIEDEKHSVCPGDFIAYPAGGPAHKLINTGDTTLKFLVVGRRQEHDVIDYPLLKKRMYQNKKLGFEIVDIDNIEEAPIGKKK